MTTLKQYEINRYSRILGYGAARGEVIVRNDDIVEAIDSSDEWIRQRTGIITRHRASENQSVTDLAIGAAKDALQSSGVAGEDIEAVIISTISHPYATPSLATIVADAIGSKCPAYDISAACAGFCYGIAQADALVRAGTAKNVLVIGVEKLSNFIDNTERSISFLLGDGAGAAVVGVSDEPGIARLGFGWIPLGHRRHDPLPSRHSQPRLRCPPRPGRREDLAHPASGWPLRFPLGRLGDG